MIGRLRFRIVGDLPLLEARVRPLEGAGGSSSAPSTSSSPPPRSCCSLRGSRWPRFSSRATSRGGVFYRQTRVGRDGRPFELWKLRTMREGRGGRDGRRARRARRPARDGDRPDAARARAIDEIPQLWNVLRGDMSLVGPRPERPEFAQRFAKTVSGYALRHAARPGLTGLAQVSGEYSTEPEIKLRYDLAYLNNWSFGLDLAILLRTLPVVLTRRGI